MKQYVVVQILNPQNLVRLNVLIVLTALNYIPLSVRLYNKHKILSFKLTRNKYPNMENSTRHINTISKSCFAEGMTSLNP